MSDAIGLVLAQTLEACKVIRDRDSSSASAMRKIHKRTNTRNQQQAVPTPSSDVKKTRVYAALTRGVNRLKRMAWLDESKGYEPSRLPSESAKHSRGWSRPALLVALVGVGVGVGACGGSTTSEPVPPQTMSVNATFNGGQFMARGAIARLGFDTAGNPIILDLLIADRPVSCADSSTAGAFGLELEADVYTNGENKPLELGAYSANPAAGADRGGSAFIWHDCARSPGGAGTITLTHVSRSYVEGSFDIEFSDMASPHVSGTFTLPVGCEILPVGPDDPPYAPPGTCDLGTTDAGQSDQ